LEGFSEFIDGGDVVGGKLSAQVVWEFHGCNVSA
jgi:hypothetical protein